MKRLTFAFIIVLSLFVLGGCDQLLEAFFPYDTYTDKSVSGDADYSVAVSINYASELSGYMVAGGKIMVALIPFNQSNNSGISVYSSGIIRETLSQADFEDDSDGRDSSTTVTFTTWMASMYKVLVWVDEDSDEHFIYEYDPYASTTEPAAFAFTTDSYEEWVDLSYVQPQSAGIDMVASITSYSFVDTSDFNSNSVVEEITYGPVLIEWDNVLVSEIEYRYFTPDIAGQYMIHWEDNFDPYQNPSYSGDITVSATGALDGYYFFDEDSGYSPGYPQTISVSAPQVITIILDPYYSAGTCRLWITKVE